MQQKSQNYFFFLFHGKKKKNWKIGKKSEFWYKFEIARKKVLWIESIKNYEMKSRTNKWKLI